MKHSLITLALVFCWIAGFAQQAERNISVIPEPVSLLKKGGHYVLPDEVVVSIPSGKETAYVAGLLKEKLSHDIITVKTDIKIAKYGCA